MKHEEMLTSRTVSQRLKQIGVDKNSEYWWVCCEGISCDNIWEIERRDSRYLFTKQCAAYSDHEIFDMLTTKIKSKIQISWYNDLWHVTYERSKILYAGKLSDALAELLIYLTGYNKIKIDKDAG